ENRAGEDDLDELAEIEHAEAQAGVLDEMADDFGFALDLIERRAFGFGNRTGQKEHEPDRLGDDAPMPHIGPLRLDQRMRLDGAADEEQAQKRQTQRNIESQQLRRG